MIQNNAGKTWIKKFFYLEWRDLSSLQLIKKILQDTRDIYIYICKMMWTLGHALIVFLSLWDYRKRSFSLNTQYFLNTHIECWSCKLMCGLHTTDVGPHSYPVSSLEPPSPELFMIFQPQPRSLLWFQSPTHDPNGLPQRATICFILFVQHFRASSPCHVLVCHQYGSVHIG